MSAEKFELLYHSRINAGLVSDLHTEIQDNNGFLYKPEGRMWITEYPLGSLEKARAVYSPNVLTGMEEGLVTTYQKCPHLGCRVHWEAQNDRFFCPCHNGVFNADGLATAGPPAQAKQSLGTVPVIVDYASGRVYLEVKDV